MAKVGWFFSICVVFCSTINTGSADPASQKIYIQLYGENICFRRLNATHQVGCTSKSGGNVGVVQLVETKEDLREVLDNGQFAPYVIAISYLNFSSPTLRSIQESGKANGVLVLFDEEIKPDEKYDFSPDQTCPNAYYGMYRENLSNKECATKWNLRAQNTLFENWDFPIFAVRNKDDIKELKERYRTFNSPESLKADKWPLCAAELRSYMLAAKDAKTCIRRSKLYTNIHHTTFCRPLGDRNIWSTLIPLNKSDPIPDEPMIVVAARLDAASMFDGVGPGADSTVTGLVTLLAVAEALSKIKEEFRSNKTNVMFALFNGESYDYIGSSKMVYEMEQGRFPSSLDDSVENQSALVNLSSISHFIELSQLSSGTGTFVHADDGTRSNKTIDREITKMIESLKSSMKGIQASAIPTLPAASLQSFLHKNKQIAGIVLSNYDANYANKYYNSIFDLGSTVTDTWSETGPLFIHLASVASAVAETVFLLGTGKTTSIPINVTRIRDMCLCYLNSSDCTLFRESVDSDEFKLLSNVTYPLYVSVDPFMNTITKLTLQLLARLTGDVLENVTKSECNSRREDQIFRYIWMQGPAEMNKSGVCVKTTANYSRAVSPAFEIDEYDFDLGEYSTWTESEWEATSIRIFLKPSKTWEVTVLMTGLAIFILSFFSVWLIDKNAKTLFPRSQVGL